MEEPVDGAVDLEVVVDGDGGVSIPASSLGALGRPGSVLRVHVAGPADHRVGRSMLGALAAPGRPRLELEDFDELSARMWRDTPYAS